MNSRILKRCCAAPFALLAVIALPAFASPFQLVSVVDPTLGPPVGGSGDSSAPILSPDGRYVLFASTANNLWQATNGTPIHSPPPRRWNVYLRDRSLGTTTLVSESMGDFYGGEGDSLPLALSTNGRFTLFESSAANLYGNDTNDVMDVYLRDLVLHGTFCVSHSTNDGVGNGASHSGVMTPDGQYIAFVSAANNLVADDTNGIPDVFLLDRQANETRLVSLGAQGSPAGMYRANTSETPSVTPDGRFVMFASTATNLVADVPLGREIYIRDLAAGKTYWASAGARPALGAAPDAKNVVSFNSSISADGKFVAYEAGYAYGLSPITTWVILRYNRETGSTDTVRTNAYVPAGAYEDIDSLDMTPDGRFIAFVANADGYTNTTTGIYVWDAQTGMVALASGDSNNVIPPYSTCDWPTLDSSGRYVAFLSNATNLVTNVLAGEYHLYRRDMQNGTTLLLDADTNGVGSPLTPATVPRLSADGRLVAFECADGNLVPNDRNREWDVFVRDLETGASEIISAHDPALASVTPNGSSTLTESSVSYDGRFIAFSSEADNLVPPDTNAVRDVFVRDLMNGTNILVSVATNGTSADGFSIDPVISTDGRHVVFTSSADNLVAGDKNCAFDVFLRDWQAGTTMLISVSTNGIGSGNGSSYSPTISADGRYILFRSQAKNLAALHLMTGNPENVYYRDISLGKTFALTPVKLTVGTREATMTPDGRFVLLFEGLPTSGTIFLWDAQLGRLVFTNDLPALTGMAVSPDARWIVYLTGNRQLNAIDRVAGTKVVLSPNPAAARPGFCFSADSRFLTFVVREPSKRDQVYLHDFQTGENLLASRSAVSAAVGAEGNSCSPAISRDGRFVAYSSDAMNLVPDDTNQMPDVFIADRVSSRTFMLSLGVDGYRTSYNRSVMPVFSGDGKTLVFQSWVQDLVPRDFDRNGNVFAFKFVSASIVPNDAPGAGFWLSWPNSPGADYRVQFKTGLDDPVWHELEGSVTSNGGRASMVDPAPADSQRIYRIKTF